MKKLIYIISLMVLGTNMLMSQALESDNVTIRINTVRNGGPIEQPDTMPPYITVISPVLEGDRYYLSSSSEVELIGRVSDDSEISYLKVGTESISIGESGAFSTTVKLNRGPNQIRIIALDEYNNWSEKSLICDYNFTTPTLAEKISNESKYYALIIGISEYQDERIPDLGNPVSDCEQLFDALTKNYCFDEENVTFLKNATRDEMINSLDRLVNKVTDKDNLLIFYAGHGQWDSESNNGFWLPTDATLDTRSNWFRNSTMVDYLQEIKSKHILLIADACFGGSIFTSRAPGQNLDKAYEKIYELPSRKAMTSGTLTEVPDRSYFVYYLIDRLNNNEDTYMSSEQLFSSFRIAVINNSDVVPQYGDIKNVGDQGGDFIFLRKQ